jgi:tol-pal system protein YbgF
MRPPAPPAPRAAHRSVPALLAAPLVGVLIGLVGSLAGPAAAQQQSGLAAELLARLNEQEAALRRLTAQLEALQFETRNRERQLEARIADLQDRIVALEGGDPFATGAAPAPARAPAPAAPATPAAPASGRGTAVATAPPPRPLGTLRLSEAQAEEARAFEEARRTLANEGLERGLTAFGAFGRRYPGSPLNGDAAYWLGQAYFERGRFEEAARQFLVGVRDFPAATRSPDNLLGLGRTLVRLGQRSDACATFAELRTRFPAADPAVLSAARQAATEAACP